MIEALLHALGEFFKLIFADKLFSPDNFPLRVGEFYHIVPAAASPPGFRVCSACVMSACGFRLRRNGLFGSAVLSGTRLL